MIESVELDRYWKFSTEATVRQTLNIFRQKDGNWQATGLASFKCPDT